MILNLGGFRFRTERNFVMADEAGPVTYQWAITMGIARPSFKYFPFAWTVVSLEREVNGPVRLGMFTSRVGDEN